MWEKKNIEGDVCGRRRTLRGMCVGEEEHDVELGLYLKTSH